MNFEKTPRERTDRQTSTSWPFRRSPIAALRPPMPAPMMAIFRGRGYSSTRGLLELTPFSHGSTPLSVSFMVSIWWRRRRRYGYESVRDRQTIVWKKQDADHGEDSTTYSRQGKKATRQTREIRSTWCRGNSQGYLQITDTVRETNSRRPLDTSNSQL